MHHVITSQYFNWKLHFHAIKVDFCWASLDVQEKCRQKLARGWKFLRVNCKCSMIMWPRCRWCEYVFISGSPQSSEMEPFLLTIMAQMEEHMQWRLHGSLWTVSPASKTTHCCSSGKVKLKRLSEHKKSFSRPSFMSKRHQTGEGCNNPGQRSSLCTKWLYVFSYRQYFLAVGTPAGRKEQAIATSESFTR